MNVLLIYPCLSRKREWSASVLPETDASFSLAELIIFQILTDPKCLNRFHLNLAHLGKVKEGLPDYYDEIFVFLQERKSLEKPSKTYLPFAQSLRM